MIQSLADAIEREHAQVWQWLNGTRNICERTAQHIEAQCKLPPGWLSGDARLGRVVDEVVGALDRKDVDEIIGHIMFKVQQASTNTLAPERFSKYMEMLSRFKGGDGNVPPA